MKYLLVLLVLLLFFMSSCHQVNYTTHITYQNGDSEILYFELRNDLAAPYLENGCLHIPGYNGSSRCGVRSIYNTVN
jgi:hypothetical protein